VCLAALAVTLDHSNDSQELDNVTLASRWRQFPITIGQWERARLPKTRRASGNGKRVRFAGRLSGLPAYVFWLGSYFFIVNGDWQSANVGEWLMALALTLGFCGYIFIGQRTIILIVRRRAPLAIIDDAGIRLPFMKPGYLAWSNIANVEQTVLGGWTILRLVLKEPERHLGKWQRRIAWPFGDSVMVKIALETSSEPSAVYNAAHDAHRRSLTNRSPLSLG
jgi:hypothetical protein